YQGSWLEISQKEPKNDRPAEGTITENPIATITNEVKSVSVSSLVTKQMTEDSSEVPEGAELVWRVEVFNGVTWQPAENIPYITLEGDWSKDTLSEASAIPTCDRILKTGPDGRIVLTKNWSEDSIERWPAVYFAEIYVGVNKYDSPDKDDYRVVEVMEESDEAWGMLKEYTTSKKGFGNNHDDGLDLTGFSAGGFMNSNENAPIEIAKEMDEDSDDTFTMILKQVLSLSSNVDYGNIREEDIIASEGRAGISYTVYDTATGEAIAERETGKNGEIQLKAGQFVRLNLSNTLWTVSEEIGHTYKLKSLTPENETKLKKLNDNLMLINCEPTYTVTYRNGFDENEILEEFTGLRKGSPTPELDDKLERPGYKFTGWSPKWQERVTESVTYTAQWKKTYTIIYQDGIGGSAFAQETHGKIAEGEKTPQYSDGKTPTRKGYIFDGWNPEWDSTVKGDKANKDGEIIYKAQWKAKKLYTVKYTDGVDGEIVFGDQVTENCVEGDPTPPYEDGTNPIRKEYDFSGWTPTWNKTVNGEDANESGEIVYTATWTKKN
ncbi:MAG: InlB B-repeat-containing protein, partial [Lachnospiraceae bacterium]|nr:InlB B-repeat-containing protein [Lachnospiraceae bacterium]